MPLLEAKDAARPLAQDFALLQAKALPQEDIDLHQEEAEDLDLDQTEAEEAGHIRQLLSGVLAVAGLLLRIDPAPAAEMDHAMAPALAPEELLSNQDLALHSDLDPALRLEADQDQPNLERDWDSPRDAMLS